MNGLNMISMTGTADKKMISDHETAILFSHLKIFIICISLIFYNFCLNTTNLVIEHFCLSVSSKNQNVNFNNQIDLPIIYVLTLIDNMIFIFFFKFTVFWRNADNKSYFTAVK